MDRHRKKIMGMLDSEIGGMAKEVERETQDGDMDAATKDDADLDLLKHARIMIGGIFRKKRG